MGSTNPFKYAPFRYLTPKTNMMTKLAKARANVVAQSAVGARKPTMLDKALNRIKANT